jgi:flavin-dependent dehydrogenase
MRSRETDRSSIERVDALVVGAGPAGLSAADELSRAGARIVVVDRHTRPGGKACGGGVTRTAWGPAGLWDDGASRFARWHERLTVHTSLGSVRLDGRGRLMATVRRPKWTAMRIARLRDRGVDIRLGARFLGFADGVARIGKNRLACDFVVGADGAGSRLRRDLGVSRQRVVRAWQLTLPSSEITTEQLESISPPAVWFEPSTLGAGYGWVFIHGDELRIGVGGSDATLDRARLKSGFDGFLARFGLARKDGKVQSGTIGCHYAGHRFGAVRLAGDAAGLASPLTGEGIEQALVSGREVAREIVDSSYRSAVIARLAVRHRRTHDVLCTGRGAYLYCLAPLLLRVPFVRRQTLERYV